MSLRHSTFEVRYSLFFILYSKKGDYFQWSRMGVLSKEKRHLAMPIPFFIPLHLWEWILNIWGIKKAETKVSAFLCGERGIRTPGGVTLAGFQDQCIRPLCHFSMSVFDCSNASANIKPFFVLLKYFIIFFLRIFN